MSAPSAARSPAVARRASRRPALAVGGRLPARLAAGFALDRGQFFRSYLFGFLFWVGIAVGSLGLAMLNHLTGGLWGARAAAPPRGGGAHAARRWRSLFVPVAARRLRRSTPGRSPRSGGRRAAAARRPPT